MTTRAKTTILALSLVSLLAAPFADAARLGKGKSYGMRRAAPTQSYQQPYAAPAQPATPAPAPAQAAPQRKGPGVGTAIAAGAAGAVGGYMLGKAMSGNASGNAAGHPAEQGLPWGTIALFGLLIVGGVMFLRRRTAQAMATPPASGYGQQPQPANGSFHYEPQQPAQPSSYGTIPKIGSGLGAGSGIGGGVPGYSPANQGRLPDGTEVPNFLRQAKATFLHLQSLNSPDAVEEVRKYMTPELFAALRDDIASNNELADFPSLDCQVIEAVEEAGRYIASVRFSGTVSESVNAPAEPFAETWHYIKDASTQGKWLVAGIQQG
ncbi:Tim44 domain-containing protein [Crenobacter sp. SG2303]|uniref:Tim44 domain-containing protein n=1 Tax=Crenobacter oryzisoli TaxID=3056844 RepID=A0ABT7XLI2_9NEIS|nr:Tim44 domain-containing protein [Crenobacter sp. SG2303]MDN0074641.1 Tim44 domain-containing protein [Crenobacter sp. SG2303]